MPSRKRNKEAPAGVKEMLHEIATFWGCAAPEKLTLPMVLMLYSVDPPLRSQERGGGSAFLPV